MLSKEQARKSRFKELLDSIREGENIEYVLEYDDFCVIKIEDSYFYIDHSDEDEILEEVELIGEIMYDINNDIDDDELYSLHDGDVCGENVYDDHITYYWFNFKC